MHEPVILDDITEKPLPNYTLEELTLPAEYHYVVPPLCDETEGLKQHLKIEPPPFSIDFRKNNKDVGRFFVTDRRLYFEGEVTQSAAVFIAYVLSTCNVPWLQDDIKSLVRMMRYEELSPEGRAALSEFISKHPEQNVD